MKTTTILSVCLLLASICVQAQTFKASEVEAVDKQLYDALRVKDLNGILKNMAPDAVIYGTDPNDHWPLATFRKKIEEDIRSNRLNLDVTTLSRDIKPMAGGRIAVVTKQAKWPFADTPVREVSVYENNNGWKLKTMHLSVLLPDDKLPQLNQIVSTSTGSSIATNSAGSGVQVTTTRSVHHAEQELRDIIAQVSEGRREFVYTDDVYFNTGRYPKPIIGRKQLEAARGEVNSRSPRSNEKSNFKPQKLVVAESGDVAYEHGVNTISYDGANNSRTSFDTSYLRVWRKVGNEWKVEASFVRPIE